jgi:penicillin-binding protein 1C
MASAYLDVSTNFPLNDKVALYHTFEAMREVNRPDQMDWKRVSSVRNIAWKTGTSYGSRDAWAVGLTPDYVVGVWVGNADGSGTPDLTGAMTAGPVMFDLMNLLPYSEWFESPVDMTEISVCRHSGHRAGRFCSETITQIGGKASVNAPVCPYCRPVHLSQDGRYQVVDRSEKTITRNMFILPPAIEHYYRSRHPEYSPLPPVKLSQVNGSHAATPMRFLTPADGSVIRLARQMDGQRANFTCSVSHSDPDIELFWHCDDTYVGVTKDLHTIQMDVSSGVHTISATDTYGQTESVTIRIIWHCDMPPYAGFADLPKGNR